ncbi:MAG: AraC family transcriptional regulator [Angelakisella sp.]
MDSTGYKHSYKSIGRGVTSLSVYNVGYQKCDSNQPWGPGVRDHFLIHHVVSGKGSYSIFGKTYHISAGETFLAYPDTTISYGPDAEDPWEYYWVGWSGSDARTLLRQTDFSRTNPVISTDFGDDLRELLLGIYESRGSKPHEQARMAGGLYLFLAYLMEHSTAPVESIDSSTGYLNCALDFVAGNYSRNISVEDIAQSSGISRSGLYRAFMKHLGISPVRYLSNLRVEQACTLLRRSDLSVEAVACSVGFEDALYFSRVFKARMGISPRKYSRCELPPPSARL